VADSLAAAPPAAVIRPAFLSWRAAAARETWLGLLGDRVAWRPSAPARA